MPTRLRGSRIAPAAKDWLQCSRNPQIYSIHRTALNLINEQGQLMALVLPEIGPGPFALLVHPHEAVFGARGGFVGVVALEDHVAWRDTSLVIGNAEVKLSKLQDWSARPPWGRVDPEQLQPHLALLVDLLARHAPEGSLAPLIGDTFRGDDPGAADHAAAILGAAAAPARGLIEAATKRREGQLAQAAKDLAGLGMGVTPSGDDFMVGAMYALWATADASDAGWLSSVMLNNALPRTNRMSAAWLTAAARGEAAEPWHQLVKALLQGHGAGISAAVLRLVQTGHTSGADSLAGFIALLLELGKEKTAPWQRRGLQLKSDGNRGHARSGPAMQDR